MKIICFLPETADLYMVGRVLTGIYEQPGAKVNIRFVDWSKALFSVGVEIDGKKFGIELGDHRDEWDTSLLDWCDVYAKRSLHPDFLPPEAKNKTVIPYGPHCSGRSKRSMAAVLLALTKSGPRSLRSRVGDLYRYAACPHWSDFEHTPNMQVSDTILFQTRIWEPSEVPGDESVNEERVNLLRALRAEFKHRVVGGVVPTPYALEHYPDLITSQPTRQPQYIQWAKSHAIGIYSRGLFGSVAFKMAEFMASSKCIVTDPIDNLLPAPLEHVSTYRSAQECLAHCERLLSNPALIQESRRETWEYYSTYVKPQSVISNLIAAHS